VQVRFRREAVRDVVGARAWYDDEAGGLGDAFAASLGSLIGVITEFPEAFPEIAVGRRRALLDRFPYALYYRIDQGTIDVLACLHTSRNPDTRSARG
jgi:plasmid stabilization system protein ParE